jgi:hypothetical protein
MNEVASKMFIFFEFFLLKKNLEKINFRFTKSIRKKMKIMKKYYEYIRQSIFDWLSRNRNE